MKRYFKIWLLLSLKYAQVAFSSRFSAIFLIIGKLLRFGFFFFFLTLLFSQTNAIAGYSFWQTILFFITFNFIDTAAQLMFREVYRFRSYVISGELDYFFSKPISPLFRGLFGGSDALDVPLFIISIGFIVVAFLNIPGITFLGVLAYVLLILNALLIATSIHIFVLAMGILTAEVDNIIWIYRDSTQMGRVPIDVYKQPLRGIITFAIPVGIMISFPVQALLGLLSLQFFLIALAITFFFLVTSIYAWKYALSQYSSASS